MEVHPFFKKLNEHKYFHLYAVIVFYLSVAISSINYDNYTFPMSSYSNLGNPDNDLFMVFNLGLIISVILLSIYVRYITLKLFDNTELYRISYIIPVITAVLIGVFPQQTDKSVHPAAVTLNVIILLVLAPVNAVGLWRMSRKLFFLLGCITIAFVNIATATLVIIPFDWQKLGVLETVIFVFIVLTCSILEWFSDNKLKLSDN